VSVLQFTGEESIMAGVASKQFRLCQNQVYGLRKVGKKKIKKRKEE